MKVASVEATPLAIPLEQKFHWSGGSQLGANLVLFSVQRTTASSATASRSARTPPRSSRTGS